MSLTATPTFSFVAITSTHWRSFIPPTTATATAATAVMTMSSLAAASRELLDLLHDFFKHIYPLFIHLLELVVCLV